MAAVLGASKWKIFSSVTLPLVFPGIVSGGLLGFARSLGEFGATITFVGNIPDHTQTLPLAIYSSLQSINADEKTRNLVLICVGISLLSTCLGRVFDRKS
jgi:molybdate transport system permease protein